ncbi:MAG TPA: TIGR03067 domain-containing protein [Steroidobacteraceae bacterium]
MRAPCCLDLDGTWVPVAADVSGRRLSVAQLRVARFVIQSESYRIVDASSQVVDRGQLELDQASVPCALDIIGIEGPYAGKRMRAIIELDGDRLCICYDLEQERRPQTTRATGDQLLLSITYARAGPGFDA